MTVLGLVGVAPTKLTQSATDLGSLEGVWQDRGAETMTTARASTKATQGL